MPSARPPRGPRGRWPRGRSTIQAIQVEGNQRIEEGTILSYMLVQPGDPFDPDRIDRSLKTLYATGLFQDVDAEPRQGDTLVVQVVENPIVNRIAFEGNHKLTDEQLRAELQLRSRAVFTPGLAAGRPAAHPGRLRQEGPLQRQVEPQIIRLARTASMWCSRSTRAKPRCISRIAFVGNHEFSEDRLKEVICSREGVGGASCPRRTPTTRSG